MIHWLNQQYFFNEGSNYWQWAMSIVGLFGWPVAFWQMWHHRCKEPFCVRPGQVPVRGTHHKVCKKHAHEGGHTH